MPRRRRLVIEGAVYHLYNRSARGEDVFSATDEAERFVELLRHVRDRDSLTILAWCLMSNHYHIAVRIGPVPLARTMAHLQARFSMGHNRRLRSSGPVWQSRYKAKMVNEQHHLLQLVAYVHCNPVAAGLATDPARHRYSGHRELIGKPRYELVDVEAVLLLFGATEGAARKSYLEMLRGARQEPWQGEGPGRLPWWSREIDRPLEGEVAGPRLDPLGGSSGVARRAMPAEEFLQCACAALGASIEEMVGGGLDRVASRRRYLIAGLAIERWTVRAGVLAKLFGRRPEVISRWVRQAGALRTTDASFREAFEALDAALAEGPDATQ